jgi:TonB family protein
MESWVESLAFFERPDRSGQLATLAARASAAHALRISDAELSRLEQRTRKRAASFSPSKSATWWRWVRVALPYTIASVLVAAIVGAGWHWRARLEDMLTPAWAELSAAFSTATKAAPGSRASATEPAPISEAPSRPQRPADTSTAAPSIQDLPDSPVGSRNLLSMGTTPAPSHDPNVALVLPGASGPRLLLEPATADPAESRSDVIVYSASDSEVVPPVLIGHPLPSPRGLEAWDAGVFDLTIDEQGQVEQVRLVSRSNRFHERMLVSAAKAWRFEPARRHGQPVKYRTQVRVSW